MFPLIFFYKPIYCGFDVVLHKSGKGTGTEMRELLLKEGVRLRAIFHRLDK